LITQRLKAALALIDVRLLDHLIVGEQIFSFAEAGLL
jgi:DNA repair protein RadC